MAFCRSCGAQLGDNEQFCYSCGAQQNVATGQAAQQVSGVNGESIKVWFNEIVGMLKGMVTAPVSTIKAAVKGNYRESSFILALLLGLIQGLLFILSIKQAITGITGLMAGKAAQTLTSSLSVDKILMKAIGTSYGKLFLIYLLLFILFEGLIFAGSFGLGNYVLRGKGSVIGYCNAAILAAVPYTLFMLVGLILGFISYFLGQFAVMFGIIISVIAIYNGIKENAALTDDKSAFLTGLLMIITVLIVMLIAGAIVKGAIVKAVQNQIQDAVPDILNGLF